MTYDIDIDSYIGYPITSEYIKEQLKAFKGKPCNVRINSFGGDVATALDIRQQFIDHGDVTAYIYGFTASAATILAMGAKRIVMSSAALMLIHRCAAYIDCFGSMNAEELNATIQSLVAAQSDLETIDGLIVAVYALRTGVKPEQISAVMQKGAWMTANECLALHLIDGITEDEAQPVEVTDSIRHQFVACGLPIPEDVLNAQPYKMPAVNTDTHSLKKIGEKLKNMFSSQQQKTDKKIMDNKTYPTLVNLLHVNALELREDGTCELTEKQLNELNDTLAAVNAKLEEALKEVESLKQQLSVETSEKEKEQEEKETTEKEKEELQKEVDDLKAQVKTLQSLDGATDPDVKGEPSAEKPAFTAYEMYNRIKGI